MGSFLRPNEEPPHLRSSSRMQESLLVSSTSRLSSWLKPKLRGIVYTEQVSTVKAMWAAGLNELLNRSFPKSDPERLRILQLNSQVFSTRAKEQIAPDAGTCGTPKNKY
eukprot:156193-Pelagomonas_calceolata.AAC.1